MIIEPYADRMVFPARSMFQLRHFVVGQHDTPAMQWRQIVIEAQDLLFSIRMAELTIEKNEIEIDNLLSEGGRLNEILAEEKRLSNIVTQRAIESANIELACLRQLADETGSFTWDEIEADQHTYWQRRIKRQADADVFGAQHGINPGNVASLMSLGMVREEDETCAIAPGN